jgi:hypothetical protein
VSAGSWDPHALVTGRPVSRVFTIAVVAAFVIISGFVAAHHEPWRDEADQWLFVRDASFATILGRTRYTGRPALWYFILAPLAKLGLPYASQKVLHLAVAAAAVGVLVARAPFSRLTKLLAAFSYYLAYEYSVIVRGYALPILLTFLAAAFYRRSRDRPIAFAILLLLLFNTEVQGFVIAAAFAVLFVLDCLERRSVKRDELIAIAIMAAGALAAWLQVRTPPDPAREGVRHIFNPDAFAWAVGNAFLPKMPYAVGCAFGLLLLLLLTLALRRAHDATLFLWLPTAVLALVYSYIWIGGLRHAGFFLLLALVAVWIAGDRVDRKWEAPAALLLNVALLVSAGVAVRYWIDDTRYAFSGAEEMAAFIADHHLDRVPIAAHNLTQAEALLPWLPGTKFWYAGLGESGTYLKWDDAYERALDVPYPVAERRAVEHFRGRPWLLLFNVEMPDPAAHGFRLLYTNQRPIFEKPDERYWLYQPVR